MLDLIILFASLGALITGVVLGYVFGFPAGEQHILKIQKAEFYEQCRTNAIARVKASREKYATSEVK